MANKGLKYPVVARYNENNGVVTYSDGMPLGAGISVRINLTHNNERLYGNDTVILTDKTINGGTVALNMTNLTDAVKVAVLGYTEGDEIDAITHAKELIKNTLTEPPYVGFGVYGESKDDNNIPYWRAIWIKKTQFTQPSEEYDTKTGNATFKTPSLEGEIMKAADDGWVSEGTFSTEAGAIAWLNSKAGISDEMTADISALTISNCTLTPTFAGDNYNYSGTATGNVEFTVTAAGTIKLYVDGILTQTLTTAVKGAAITMAEGANKLMQIRVQESGKKSKTYTIMMQRAAG